MDEQQYEIGVVVSDTILVWAVSAEQAQDKTLGMGYVNITSVEAVNGDD